MRVSVVFIVLPYANTLHKKIDKYKKVCYGSLALQGIDTKMC